MADPKWKRFERLVYEIQKDLAQDAEVKLNDLILGEDSKTERQIDISIRKQIGQYTLLIVIDCKDHKTPLDVKDVGEFISTVKDVRANKGALIASSGFTSGAIELAKTQRIDTFTLVDTESTDWRTYLAIPVLLERTWLERFAFIFRGFGSGTLPGTLTESNPGFFRVFSKDGQSLGILRDILARMWNEQKISQEPGEREEMLAKDVFLEVENQKLLMDISARVIVSRAYYFGFLPIQTRGLKDEQGGGIITRELKTAEIAPFEIEQGLIPGWKKVDDPTKIAVRPVIRLVYSDQAPTSE